MMKRLFLFGWLVVGVGFVFAQGMLISGGRRWTPIQTYDPKTPPPLLLPEAYSVAVSRISSATNRFHCVSASCLVLTNNGFTGWTFGFSNANGERARVDVFFDREVYIGVQSADLLFGK